jgi:hypothetical protein
MCVSIETSGNGFCFKTLDAEQGYDDAAGTEIYKNLRWLELEAHEPAGVIVMLTSRRGSTDLHMKENI